MVRKNVETVKDPAIAWAEHLWERLEANLLDTQNTIIAIIDAKAWEPLGYESFSKAWVDRIMSRITIASELRPHVVYQMFEEGLTTDQVATIVSGVGKETAEFLKRQKDNDVPAGAAEIIVRKHNRRKPEKHWITFEVTGDEMMAWRKLARKQKRSVNDLAAAATRALFEEMA